MKIHTLPLILIMILNFLLLACACGRDDGSGSVESPLPETAEAIPDYSSWSRMAGANDQCLGGDATHPLCTSEFVPQKNCGLATFKFISVTKGYMYIQTKKEILVRQGEYMKLTFDETPEIFNISDNSAERSYAIFKCLGSDGAE